MAQILISEPHEDVRRLLVRMVTRLGHTAILAGVPSPLAITSADVLLVEPAEPVGAVLAQAACLAVPSLPIICASVASPPVHLEELGVVFAGSLLKPFTLEQLGAAIDRALIFRPRAPLTNHDKRQDAA